MIRAVVTAFITQWPSSSVPWNDLPVIRKGSDVLSVILEFSLCPCKLRFSAMIKTLQNTKTFISCDFSSAKLYFCTSYCWEAWTSLFLKSCSKSLIYTLSYILALFPRKPEILFSVHSTAASAATPTVDYFFQQWHNILLFFDNRMSETGKATLYVYICGGANVHIPTALELQKSMSLFCKQNQCRHRKTKDLHHLQNFAINNLAAMYWWCKISWYLSNLYIMYKPVQLFENLKYYGILLQTTTLW